MIAKNCKYNIIPSYNSEIGGALLLRIERRLWRLALRSIHRRGRYASRFIE